MPDVPDPFKPVEPTTILRPRPGAGRRGDTAFRAPAPEAMPEPLPASVRNVTAPGLNPLVQAASPLLMLAGHLRNTLTAPDVAGLRRHAVDEIHRFEERARTAGLANDTARAANYVLCAGLDEAVLSTPWGAQSEWAQQTLLVALHREAWGGEKFFAMLDRLRQDPGRHLDLMELQYLCLAFGFSGKYQVQNRGDVQLAEVQQDLYRQIRGQRGAPAQELALRWRGLEDRRNPLIRYVPWWVVGAAALAVLSVTFIVYWTWLGSAATPVEGALAKVGFEEFADVARPAPAGAATLKQLLKADEDRGALSVREGGGRTVIVVAAPDLFTSGSAVVNAGYAAVLGRIAAALEQVPGRVTVVGHTDDQPVRSLRYRNNTELSRERAASVVGMLRTGVSSPARLDWTGVGDDDPLPGVSTSDPRNRRVEIVHRGG